MDKTPFEMEFYGVWNIQVMNKLTKNIEDKTNIDVTFKLGEFSTPSQTVLKLISADFYLSQLLPNLLLFLWIFLPTSVCRFVIVAIRNSLRNRVAEAKIKAI